MELERYVELGGYTHGIEVAINISNAINPTIQLRGFDESECIEELLNEFDYVNSDLSNVTVVKSIRI